MNCKYCGAQTTDTYLCKNHTNRLRNVLTDLAEAWDDSEITLARLNKHAPQAGGGRSGETQLAFNVNCSDVRHESNDVISMWAGEVGEGVMPGWLRTVPQQCRWLATLAQKASTRDFAGQMLTELENELAELHRAVDRPADRIVVGQCDVCGHDLTAPLRTDEVVCPHCEIVVNVKAQKDAKVAEALDDHYLPDELARLIPMIYRIHVTEKTIVRWIRQRRLKTNDAGRCSLRSAWLLAEKVALQKTSA